MNFKSIRKFFGIKTYAEKYAEFNELLMIEYQKTNDMVFGGRLEFEARSRFNEEVLENEFIEGLDKTKPYWQLQIPTRWEKNVVGIYYVDHPATAKFLNIDSMEWIKNRVKELHNERNTKI